MENRKVLIDQSIVFIKIGNFIFVSLCLVMASLIMIDCHRKGGKIGFCFPLFLIILCQYLVADSSLSLTLMLINIFPENSVDKFIIYIPAYKRFLYQMSFLELFQYPHKSQSVHIRQQQFQLLYSDFFRKYRHTTEHLVFSLWQPCQTGLDHIIGFWRYFKGKSLLFNVIDHLH